MHKYTITSYLKKNNIWLHPHFITV